MKRLTHRTKQIALLASLSFLTSLAPAPLHAQVATGTITGHITDPSGAVVIGAAVKLSKADTGLTLQAVTNKDGIYNFSLLQPGTYDLIVTQSGFNAGRTSVVLAVAQTAEVDLSLNVGSDTKTVTVQAGNAAQLETQNSGLDFLVGSQEISDLPLNGRNPYGLAALSPGIVPELGFGAGTSTLRAAAVAADNANFEANGTLGAYNTILLDGVPIVVCCQGQPAVTPSVEDVDQFKVLTSVPPAQFGQTSGGVLNLVTKAGTNTIRGDIYEYFRNDALDAADFFAKRAGTPPIPGRNDYRLPHHFNQFGGIVGGPVVLPKIYHGKDKTFFFFGYEGVRAETSSFVTTTVPTILERKGIFTEAPGPLYDPTNIYPDPAHPGQHIRKLLPPANGYPAGRDIPVINPVAQAYLNLFPTPNAPGVANNYSYSSTELDADNQYTGRIDHMFSPAQHIYGRLTYDASTSSTPDLFGHRTGANSGRQLIAAYVFTLDYTWALSTNTLLNFQYGFPLQKNTQYPGNYFNYNPTSYGFTSNFAGQQIVKGLPYVAVSGFASLGVTADILLDHYMHTLGVNAILQRGRHTITVGGDGRLMLENEGTLTNPVGSFSFGASFDNGPNPNGAIPSAQSPFNSFASFLQGYPSTAQLVAQDTVALNQRYGAIYLQDDWKYSPKLTFNLGIRYEMEDGWKERHNHWADFDPNGATPLADQTGLPIVGAAQFLGVNGNPNRTWKTRYNVAPRLGFSYNALPNTVLRGGYGILYVPTSMMFYRAASIGYQQNNAYVASIDGFTPAGTVSNPFPSGIMLPQGPAGGVQSGTGTGLTAIVYNKRTAYEQQWNLGIEQGIAHGLIFSLNYAGSLGVRLPISKTPNDLLPKYFGSVGDQQQVAYLQTVVANPFHGIPNSGSLNTPTIQRAKLLATYPQYSSVTEQAATEGTMSYSALQASIVARSISGLTLSAAYAWSKAMGDTNDMIGGVIGVGTPHQEFIPYQNYYLKHQYERSTLVTDAPQRFTSAASYKLPFGHGASFGGNVAPWLNRLIGGWQLNSVISVQSGFPLPLSETGQEAFSGARPSFVPGIAPLTIGNIHQRLGGANETQGYFNPKAFRLTKSFEMGNVPRAAGNLRSPVAFQDDLSLIKQVPIKESLSMQIRLEAFNALNKVGFGWPGTQFGSATFGIISNQANLPRNVQVAMKLFW